MKSLEILSMLKLSPIPNPAPEGYIERPVIPVLEPYIRWAELLPLEKNGGRHAVYDADSVKLYIDNGFFQERLRIATRLNRINAFEVRGGTSRTKYLAAQGRDWLRKTLEREVETYGGFWIHSVGMEQGKYGRWIIEIYLNDGTNVSDELVRRGWAIYQEY